MTRVLQSLGVATSRWYVKAAPYDRQRRRGPKPNAVPRQIEDWVVTMAKANPWYGYKRIAVMCRRADQGVTNRQPYRAMKAHALL